MDDEIGKKSERALISLPSMTARRARLTSRLSSRTRTIIFH